MFTIKYRGFLCTFPVNMFFPWLLDPRTGDITEEMKIQASEMGMGMMNASILWGYDGDSMEL